ncbi:MAG: HIT domain-containing protein [Synergistetes bacterium]|nr:HIT domain-containing protein [Synergistota bacterium]MDW8191878.1 HIT domain-containing protein [Synergistota bacterium]
MNFIFAPWRIEYIRAPKASVCFLCDLPREDKDDENLILYRGKSCFIIMNNYPYNPGHLMIAPYRHIGELEKLSKDELLEMMLLTQKAIFLLKKAMRPDGFNLGFNIGKVAGAGLEDHVHLHIVPRWNGDTNFMPIIADTKVVPQAVRDTYKTLKDVLSSCD